MQALAPRQALRQGACGQTEHGVTPGRCNFQQRQQNEGTPVQARMGQ
jgi:hypothetical protein